MDDPVSLERSALVKPEVDFDRLEEVLIIVNFGDGILDVGEDDGEAEDKAGAGQ